MKNILFYFALIIFSMSIISCGNEEEDPLLGDYQVYFFQSTNCNDSDDNLTFDLANGPCFDDLGIEVCADIILTINETQITLYTETDIMGITEIETQTESYTSDGNTILSCDDDGCVSIDYTLSGNEIEMNWTEEDDGCSITLRGRKI